MKIVVLHSPTAGDRELLPRKLRSLLRTAGYRPRYFSLKKNGWKKKNALAGAELVVVAGGDGSVRRAVLHLHDRGLPLALLPLGTANNICTSLGIAGEPEKIIASWRKAGRRKIDLGVAKGPWGERFFIESAGAGLIGRAISIMEAVGEATDHRLERREDRVHRDASVVLALAHELRAVRIAVAVDGQRETSGDYLLLEVMNITRAGPGLELAPSAGASDGWLDLISATSREREKLKRSLAGGIDGEIPATLLKRRKIRALRIVMSDGEFRVDDQVLLNLRDARVRSKAKRVEVEISIRPQAFEVLVPCSRTRQA